MRDSEEYELSETDMEQFISKNQKFLKYGITTGTCATAAALASASRLLFGVYNEEKNSTVLTPKGTKVEVPVIFVAETENSCEYKVIKDSGDDPDVTNGTAVHVRVQILASREKEELEENFEGETALTQTKIVNVANCFVCPNNENLYLTGGIGVGKVTKSGLEQEIGKPAINKVPRQMIFDAVSQVYELAECEERLLITVMVPEGEELAKRTFNPQLGILGGISILGTTGILEPMSEKAIVDTIALEIQQRRNMGQEKLLFCPGNYGQNYIEQYLGLPLSEGIKCSNYIGETIDLAISYGTKEFLLVGNIGKLVKLAAGIMNTHSKVADGRGEIFATHLVLCGGTKEMVQAILSCVNTEQMLVHLEEWGLRQKVMDSICSRIEFHMNRRIGGQMKYGIILFSENFGKIGTVGEVDGYQK